MSSLETDFDAMVARLSDHDSLRAGSDDPFFYFVFDPDRTLEVRDRLIAWQGRLKNAGWNVQRISFATLIWDIIFGSGRWDVWLDVEHDYSSDEIVQAISDALRAEDQLVQRVREIVSVDEPNRLVLFTEAELLNPFFRVRGLENDLHDEVKSPTIVFYPGKREGQHGLRFLDLYENDPNYRATVFGGLLT